MISENKIYDSVAGHHKNKPLLRNDLTWSMYRDYSRC